MSWTEERVETLKRMWTEGQSASQIARELGGVTRNAVIGKVHRLGLSNRNNGGNGNAEAGLTAAAKPSAPLEQPAQPAQPAQPGAGPSMRPESAAESAPEPAEAPTAEAREPASPIEAEPAQPAAPSGRRPIIPAGQPLPPQPSANEVSPEALASVRETEKKALRLSLMELTERTCKWPVGDPATEDFWFCGLPSQQGKPYCEAHVGVAFQPMSTRRDRRR